MHVAEGYCPSPQSHSHAVGILHQVAIRLPKMFSILYKSLVPGGHILRVHRSGVEIKRPTSFFFLQIKHPRRVLAVSKCKYCSPACYRSFPLVQLGTRIGTGPEGRTQAIYFRIPNALQCSKLGGYLISLDFLHYFIASFLSCCRHRNNWTTGFSIRVNST